MQHRRVRIRWLRPNRAARRHGRTARTCRNNWRVGRRHHPAVIPRAPLAHIHTSRHPAAAAVPYAEFSLVLPVVRQVRVFRVHRTLRVARHAGLTRGRCKPHRDAILDIGRRLIHRSSAWRDVRIRYRRDRLIPLIRALRSRCPSTIHNRPGYSGNLQVVLLCLIRRVVRAVRHVPQPAHAAPPYRVRAKPARPRPLDQTARNRVNDRRQQRTLRSKVRRADRNKRAHPAT